MTPTEQEIRELDAWIAEHVMKWHLIEGEKHPIFWYDENQKRTELAVEYCEHTEFQPTTDPAAAMLVLERCCEKHVWVEIEKTLKGDWFIQGDGIGLVADTLPLAICLLAKERFSQVEKII